ALIQNSQNHTRNSLFGSMMRLVTGSGSKVAFLICLDGRRRRRRVERVAALRMNTLDRLQYCLRVRRKFDPNA
ncbi:hypothetical protein PENTCL1PPCAC_25298, partial [Pristionchus entomophagus]